MQKRAHGSQLRKGRYSEPGQVYLVTTVCTGRTPIFADLMRGRCVVAAMRALSPEIATLCFVVMPDHVHWMMQLQGATTLSRGVQKLKADVTRSLRRQFNVQAKVWQSGFHERAMRKSENLRSAALYVIANPIRAGLVRTIREYPLWDAIWLQDTPHM